MVVWGQFSKTDISLLLGMGFKRIIYQMKGYTSIYAYIGEKIGLDMN